MANSSNKTRKNKKIGGSPPSSAKASPKGSSKTSKSDSGKGSRKASPKGSAKASPKSPDDVCSICLGVIDDVKFKTKCGHTFHSKCLGMWCNVRSGIAKTCPYCNQVIDEDCKDLMDVESIGIMPYLKRMFFYGSVYGRADVDKAKSDNDAVIQKYLDAPRFDPNVVDEDNNTPLHIAVERRRLFVVKNLLARREIDTNIRNSHGKLAIEIAMDMDNKDAIAAFKKHKKIPKALKGLI
jgi:hypothetical protein